jgi:hypothetical protein
MNDMDRTDDIDGIYDTDNLSDISMAMTTLLMTLMTLMIVVKLMLLTTLVALMTLMKAMSVMMVTIVIMAIMVAMAVMKAITDGADEITAIVGIEDVDRSEEIDGMCDIGVAGEKFGRRYVDATTSWTTLSTTPMMLARPRLCLHLCFRV